MSSIIRQNEEVHFPRMVNRSANYITTSKWVNQETGEVRLMDEFEKKVGRTENFMITYLPEMIALMDTLGNKKMKVVKYILKNMSKADNTLVVTTVELAQKSGVSRQTVSDTLQILEEAKIISRRTGAIMISPRLMNNKSSSKEATMLIKFKSFNE